jgi:hypothetical protein
LQLEVSPLEMLSFTFQFLVFIIERLLSLAIFFEVPIPSSESPPPFEAKDRWLRNFSIFM